MGGKSAPAPPDPIAQQMRMNQLNAPFVSSENERRQQLAQQYNSAVADFNNQLKSYQGQLNSYRSQLGGMSIRDDELFSPLSNQLNTQYSTISGLTFDTPTPNFESVAQGPYGPVTVSTPTLSNPNYSLQNSLLSDIRGLQSQLDSLRTQRQAEEKRINDFLNQGLSQLSNQRNLLQGMTIADKSGMDAVRSALGGIESSLRGFNSIILDEVLPNGFSEIESGIAGLRTQLNDLLSQRAAEENRINAYRQGLINQYDIFNNQLRGLTIADEAGINSLQDLIDAKQREAKNFSSLLNFDFSSPLNDIQSIEDQLASLRRARESELNRIQQAQSDALAAANAIAAGVAGADIYNLPALMSLKNNLNSQRAKISGFSSLLPFDFSQATNLFNENESGINTLLERRNQELAKIMDSANAIGSGVGDIPLYDENALLTRKQQAEAGLANLSRFIGSDTADEAAAFNNTINTITLKLNELGQKRAALETQAASLRDAIMNQSFYGVDDLSDPRAQLQALRSEIDLYKATQAIDEIDQAMARLQSEQQRLERDAAAVAAREAAARQSIQLGPNGQLMLGNGSVPLTDEQYSQLLAMLAAGRQQELPWWLIPSNSSFSQSVILV